MEIEKGEYTREGKKASLGHVFNEENSKNSEGGGRSMERRDIIKGIEGGGKIGMGRTFEGTRERGSSTRGSDNEGSA